MVKNTYHPGVGRRKTAVSQVRLTSGSGKYLFNGKEMLLPQAINGLFELVGKKGQFDVSVIARGGGMTSQQEATVLGVARALVKTDQQWKSTLRKSGFLTRDSRVKERKKPGLKKARRAPQWAKR